ncbi:MAG TPA: oxygenase MpaB family protein [Vicinamibacterales bacterium]|jgi:uncharacterized protein (DUF2236 family)
MDAADISRRINAERLLLVAWLRAILLQLAHPLIAAGVVGHSTFRGGAAASFSRLHQTVGAMLAITFGTHDERERALEGIRVIHRRVHGTLPSAAGVFPAGTPYSAEDSALLIWVHATLVESIVIAYEQLVAPLAPQDRDRYCADSADAAVELGARADAVPRSWDALRAYMEHTYASGHIAVAPQARTLVAALLSPIRNRLAAVLVTPVVSLLAAGQLPPGIRTQYGFGWNRRRARRYAAIMTVLRLMRRVAPPRLAFWKSARSVPSLAIRHGYSATAR